MATNELTFIMLEPQQYFFRALIDFVKKLVSLGDLHKQYERVVAQEAHASSQTITAETTPVREMVTSRQPLKSITNL